MVVNMKLAAVDTNEGVNELHAAVAKIQELTHSLEGSLHKLSVDSKSVAATCIWGLPPFAHADDPTRAVFCALQLNSELSTSNIDCSIGVSTELAFAGVIMGSSSRKEYVVVGDAVGVAKQMAASGRVCVDRGTKLAVCKVAFDCVAHVLFKGKSLKLPVYEPKDDLKEVMLVRANPFLFGSESCDVMVGRAELKERFKKDFDSFRRDSKSKASAIAGTAGSGKSLFAKSMAEHITQFEEVKVFCSHLNPLSEKKALNSWRPILVSIVSHLAIAANATKEEYIRKIVKSNSKIELIENMLGLHLVNERKVTECEVKSLFGIFIYFFEQIAKDYAVVVILDDCSSMDKVSWELLGELVKKVQKLFIYTILRCNFLKELEFASAELEVYYKHLATSTIFTGPYTMPELLESELHALIIYSSKIRIKEINQELALMIPDSVGENSALEQKAEMSHQLGAADVISKVDEGILKLIMQKAEGSITTSLELLLALLKAEYLANEGGSLILTDAFKVAEQLGDWTRIEIPSTALYTNSQLLDSTLKATTVYSFA